MRKRTVTTRPRKELAANLEQNRRVAERLHKELLSTETRFISTEIDLGVTFCSVAESSKDEERKQRNIANAKKAWETASHFIATFDLPDDVRQDLAEKLAMLEHALARIDNGHCDPRAHGIVS